MAKRSVCTIMRVPIALGPGVVVEIAYAGVIGGEPVLARENDGKGVIHVAENSHVGIEEDKSSIGSKFEDAELRPGILKARCDKIGGPIRRKERVSRMYNNEGVVGCF